MDNKENPVYFSLTENELTRDLGATRTVYNLDNPVASTLHNKIPAVDAGWNMVFSTQVNAKALVDPHIYIELPLRITLTGTCNATKGLYQPGAMGLSWMPFYEAVSTINLTINQQTITRTPRDYVYLLAPYQNIQRYEVSTDALMPDYYQQYSDATQSGFGNNVLSVEEAPNSAFSSRGALLKVITNTDTSVVLEGKLLVCLPFNPCTAGGGRKRSR